MSASLLDSLSSLITPDLIGRAASAFGENESTVTKGLGAAMPLLLGSVAHRASDPGFASTLFNLVRDPANDGSLLGNVASLLGPGAGSSSMMMLGAKLLSSLFGSNLGSVGGDLAGYSGVKPSTASSMLSFGAPLLLSVLGKAVKSGSLNASSLASLLTGQKHSYAAALPGPLSKLESYFAAPVRETHAAYSPPPVVEKSSIWRWLLPLLIALAALFMLSRCLGKKEHVVETPAPAPAVEPAPATLPAPVPEAAPVGLPAANLYFDLDKTDLPADANSTLAPVVEYLKANPSARASIAGYHDPSGDAAHNEELAKNRAGAAKAALAAAGIAEDRLDMDKPIVTTGGGPAEDARRVEVRVK